MNDVVVVQFLERCRNANPDRFGLANGETLSIATGFDIAVQVTSTAYCVIKATKSSSRMKSSTRNTCCVFIRIRRS